MLTHLTSVSEQLTYIIRWESEREQKEQRASPYLFHGSFLFLLKEGIKKRTLGRALVRWLSIWKNIWLFKKYL